MRKQKITTRLAAAFCGLLSIALLAPAGQASAATQRWEIAQFVPAQLFPDARFSYGMHLVRVGTVPSSEDLRFEVQAPSGTRFVNANPTDPARPYLSTNLSPCVFRPDQSAIDCTVPAGVPIGQTNYLVYQLEVEPGAANGPRRFRTEFSGGPGADPPLPVDSRRTEITSTESPFGIAEFDGEDLNEDGSEATQAGGHPWANSTTIRFATKVEVSKSGAREVVPADVPKNITVELPAGYIGNPEATPKCTVEQLNRMADTFKPGMATAACHPDSQVGTIVLELAREVWRAPVFNVEPRGNAPAQFGFNASGKVVTLFPEVDPNDSTIRVNVRNADQTYKLFGATLTLWGSPPDPSHDGLRRFCGAYVSSDYRGDGCPVQSLIPPVGFYVAPTSCLGPLTTTAAVTSWAGVSDTAQFTSHDKNGNPQGMGGCDRVPFDPEMSARQTADSAETPSGLDFKLSVPETGILNPSGVSQAHLRKAVVKLPEGVTLNPSAGEGLGSCSPAQYAAETLQSLFGDGCPGTSKLGSVQISSPVLPESEVLKGDFFIASPYDNPFGSLLAVYMVVRNFERGLILKAAGRVDLDPRTGQIVTTFDNLPQLPFADFELHFREGGRAPLSTPATCGTHTIEAELTPWSAKANPVPSEIAHLQSPYQITRGVGGGPCPSGGLPPFKPGLVAGTINNRAGSYSPFNVRLFRNDGEQEFTNFSIKLPPGVIGKIAGLGYCSDAAIAAAKSREGMPGGGAAELASPSCPASSLVGRTLVGAGVGSVLTYVPGNALLRRLLQRLGDLAGLDHRCQGRPLRPRHGSRALRRAGQSGDGGNLRRRHRLGPDPAHHPGRRYPSARHPRSTSTGPNSSSTRPTCDRTSTASTVLGSGLDFVSAADDQPVTVTSPFQAADCAALGFKPKLALSLSGGTKRGDNPKLKAVLTTRKGDANVGRAQVTLPHSAFLDSPISGRSAPGCSSKKGPCRGRNARRPRSTATRKRSRRSSANRCRGRSTCAPPRIPCRTWSGPCTRRGSTSTWSVASTRSTGRSATPSSRSPTPPSPSSS